MKSATKSTILISSSMIFCTLIVTVLYFRSGHRTHKHSSFTRIFHQNTCKKINTTDIKYNSYYIAGATKDNIYLGNITGQLHLLELSRNLADTHHITLSIENKKNLILKSPQVKIDDPYFYIVDGVTPFLLRGKLNEWHADKFMFDSIFFTSSTPISASSFAVRSLNTTDGFILAKVTANSPYIKLAPEILEKQVDGIFCKDGKLLYDKHLSKLVYVYYYRNQYIVMDTNMNLTYRGNTIDTFSHVRIKAEKIKSENTHILASPSENINKGSCVFNDFLLINSNLMAKNEDAKKFNSASVIDVYNLRNKTYQFSFYLDDFKNKKPRHFQVFDNLLVALFDHYAITYNLNPSHFSTADTVKTLLSEKNKKNFPDKSGM